MRKILTLIGCVSLLTSCNSRKIFDSKELTGSFEQRKASFIIDTVNISEDERLKKLEKQGYKSFYEFKEDGTFIYTSKFLSGLDYENSTIYKGKWEIDVDSLVIMDSDTISYLITKQAKQFMLHNEKDTVYFQKIEKK